MKATLTFCLLFLSAAALLGQAQNGFRISGALGFGRSSQGRWVRSATLHAGWKKTDLAYLFDHARGQDEVLTTNPSGSRVEWWQQHSLLYVISKSQESNVQFSTSIGLGYMHGVHRGRVVKENFISFFGFGGSVSQYEAVPFNAMSALLETRYTLRINDYVGVGLSAIINANAHKTFVAAQLWLECGLL